MIKVTRIIIKSAAGITMKNTGELVQKEKQIIEILGIKAGEINCIYDEEAEEPEQGHLHHFTPPTYSN